jgi:hypothetical protein
MAGLSPATGIIGRACRSLAAEPVGCFRESGNRGPDDISTDEPEATCILFAAGGDGKVATIVSYDTAVGRIERARCNEDGGFCRRAGGSPGQFPTIPGSVK